MAVTHHAMLCHVVPCSEACRGGWGRWITAPSFPQAPSWRSFPDDLTGCTFLNRLVDCFIIGGQLKRRRVPVTLLRTPSLPEPQNKGRNWAWAQQLGFPFDYFQQGSESILETVFPGDELTGAKHEQGWG